MVDLLCAVPLLDQTKPTEASHRLQFQFQHALACVADEVTVACTTLMKHNLQDRLGEKIARIEVYLCGLVFDYELTDHARLNLWHNGNMNWEPILSGEWTTERTMSFSDVLTPEKLIFSVDSRDYTPADDATTLSTEKLAERWPGATPDNTHGVFYIPTKVGHHNQTARVTLTYRIVRYPIDDDPATHEDERITGINERQRSISTTLTLEDYPDAYQPGKCLNFNFFIEDNTLITTAAIRQWQPVGSAEVEAE